MSSLKGVINC